MANQNHGKDQAGLRPLPEASLLVDEQLVSDIADQVILQLRRAKEESIRAAMARESGAFANLAWKLRNYHKALYAGLSFLGFAIMWYGIWHIIEDPMPESVPAFLACGFLGVVMLTVLGGLFHKLSG